MKIALKASVATLLGVALCLAAAGAAPGGEAAPAAKKESASAPVLPVLCGGLRETGVVVELNADTASTQLEFCAPGNTKTAPAILTAGDFQSRMTQMGLGASVLFTLPNETASRAAAKLEPIEPGKVLVVKTDLGKIWEAGEADAPLRINGAKAATLVAVKYRLPFGVRVDAPDPDKPEFVLQRGRSYAVVLKNEDPVTYRIDWNLTVAGKTTKDNLVVTPKSTAKFIVKADADYFRGLTGLFKDHDEEGKLTLSFSPPNVKNLPYWPSKVIPVKIHMRYVSENVRSWLVNGLLLLVLIGGAMFSYVGSVGLPNRLKRSDFRELLARMAQRIGAISHAVDSRLRVVIRVQCKRLTDLLKSRKNISPDLTRLFNQVSQGLASLEKQVALAEQIDAAHRRLKYLDGKGAPLSLLAAAEDAVWKAGEEVSQINPEEKKLERAKVSLETAAALMDQAQKYDEAFAKGLVERANQIKDELTPYISEPPYTDKIKPALKSVFEDFASAAAPPKTLEAAARLDQILIKRDLVRQFLQLYRANQDGEVRAKLDKQLGRLPKELGLESYQAMRRARLRVREAQEGIYPEDLLDAGKANAARIEIDPAAPQTNDPVRFSVRFTDQKLNDASARLEFEGRWDFGHDNYRESGWDPVHYFPESKECAVTFCYGGGEWGEMITVKELLSAKTPRDFWLRRDRDRAEVVRFFVTLLPAIVGLLSGAREQFLKMDVASAIFAVFLLGFSSDTVKNLVSRGQQSPSEPAPAKGAPAGEGAAK